MLSFCSFDSSLSLSLRWLLTRYLCVLLRARLQVGYLVESVTKANIEIESKCVVVYIINIISTLFIKPYREEWNTNCETIIRYGTNCFCFAHFFLFLFFPFFYPFFPFVFRNVFLHIHSIRPNSFKVESFLASKAKIFLCM